MIQHDSLTQLTDTLAGMHTHAAQHLADTLHTSALTVHTATDSLALSTDSVGPTLTDSLPTLEPWITDSAWNAIAWPVTIWGDTLTDPSSLYHELHTHGTPLPYSIFRDEWVAGLLFLCFVILTFTLVGGYGYLNKQAHDFFIPSNNSQTKPAIKTPAEIYTAPILALVLCCHNGLLLFAACSQHYALLEGIYAPRLVLAVCIAAFVVYYLTRWVLYRFINWIFFGNSKKRTWQEGFSFLVALESILLFPIILYALNWDAGIETTAIIVVSTYGLMRFLLLYHSFRIFFPKIYGLLHLFAYLCTLEIIPQFILWKILTILSAELIIK